MFSGLQNAGSELSQTVQKLRNPFMNPGFIIEKSIERFRQQKNNPRLDLDIAGHLHPTLQPSAELLEYCVKRFQYSVELALARYGE